MELSFSQIKRMQVICLTDGKNLGRVTDISFCLPENKIKGITVSGGRGLRFLHEEIFIPLHQIVKFGEDVILVRREGKKGEGCPPPFRPKGDRRDLGEYE